MENANEQRVGVRSIAWLDGGRGFIVRVEQDRSGKDGAFAAWQRLNQNRKKTSTSKSALRQRNFSRRVESVSSLWLTAVSPGTRTTI